MILVKYTFYKGNIQFIYQCQTLLNFYSPYSLSEMLCSRTSDQLPIFYKVIHNIKCVIIGLSLNKRIRSLEIFIKIRTSKNGAWSPEPLLKSIICPEMLSNAVIGNQYPHADINAILTPWWFPSGHLRSSRSYISYTMKSVINGL